MSRRTRRPALRVIQGEGSPVVSVNAARDSTSARRTPVGEEAAEGQRHRRGGRCAAARRRRRSGRCSLRFQQQLHRPRPGATRCQAPANSPATRKRRATIRPVVKGRRRFRDVVWFESLADHHDLARADVVILRVFPCLYLASVLVFPLACVLGVLGPWGTPVWPWGLLIAASDAGVRSLVNAECDRQNRSPLGFYAFRLWLWLRLGAGMRQALGTIVRNRRVVVGSPVAASSTPHASDQR